MATVVSPQKGAPSSQTEGRHKEALPGVTSLPLDEVKAQRWGDTNQAQVGKAGTASFVRTDYTPQLEEGINRHIDFETSLGYICLAIGAYFDRDTIALPGCAKYFRALSESEFGDAARFAAFQNTRGGKVVMGAVPMPDSDYFNADKGDALYAFEVALSLQKLCLDKLKALHKAADDADDFQAQDFIEAEMSRQAERIKELGNYASELKRIGKGLGTFTFDERLDV